MKISGNDDDDKIVTEFNGPRERAERLRLNQEKWSFHQWFVIQYSTIYIYRHADASIQFLMLTLIYRNVLPANKWLWL